MVAAVHVLAPGRRARATGPRCASACGRETMAAEGVLHDLGVIAMLSSRLAGHGPRRRGRPARAPERRRDEARARRRGRARRQRARAAPPRQGHDQPGDHARPRARTSARSRSGKLADAVLWWPQFAGVRPELVLKSGHRRPGARRATGTRRRCWPSRCWCSARSAPTAPRAARLSLAFLAGAALDAELPTTRPRRARSRAAATSRAADMVRNDRTGDVRVDPRDLRGHARRRAGERAAGRAGGVLRPLPAGLSPGVPDEHRLGLELDAERGRARRAAISRASATSWAVVPPPRLVSASVCLAEIATVDGSPCPRAKPARSISHAADVFTRAVRLREARHARVGAEPLRARAPRAPRTRAAPSTGLVKNEPAETESGSAGSITMPLPRRRPSTAPRTSASGAVSPSATPSARASSA